MLWFWLTLAAVLLWTASNLVDKYIGTSHLKSPVAQLVVCGLVDVPACLFLLLFFPIAFPGWELLAVLAAVAIVYFVSSFLYFKAMFSGEVSRVIALLYVMPLFLLVFAAVFLKESLAVHQYFAVLLLVAGALVLSVKKLKGLTLREGAFLALGAALLNAIMDTGVKALSSGLNAATIYFWLIVFFSVFSLAVSLVFRREISRVLESNPKACLGAAASQVICVIAWLLYFTAIGLGLVSLVAATVSLQALTVFLAAVVLSLKKPELLKEVVSKDAIMEKAVGVLLMAGGTVLLVV